MDLKFGFGFPSASTLNELFIASELDFLLEGVASCDADSESALLFELAVDVTGTLFVKDANVCATLAQPPIGGTGKLYEKDRVRPGGQSTSSCGLMS